MSAKPPTNSREERLAAKLRENLRRRKEQARVMAPRAKGSESGAADTPALPKADPSG